MEPHEASILFTFAFLNDKCGLDRAAIDFQKRLRPFETEETETVNDPHALFALSKFGLKMSNKKL